MSERNPLVVTVLVDNAEAVGLACEWGLSLHVRTGETSLLLDFGQTDAFCRNAHALGIDLATVDHAVLSHAHYDHSDGMDAFFEANAKAPLHMSAACGENCWSTKGGTTDAHYIGVRKGLLERHAQRIVRHAPDHVSTIAPGTHLVPHRTNPSAVGSSTGMYRRLNGEFVPDTFAHEMTLVVETNPTAATSSLVLLSSCSHAGVPTILGEVHAAFPDRPIEAFVGGLHLKHADDATVRHAAHAFLEHDVAQVWCGHCTGDHATDLLLRELPGHVRALRPGLSVAFSS